MKYEKWISCLIAALIAFVLSFSGVGCMVSGFGLEIGSLILPPLVCAFFSVISALCFRYRHGGTVLLGGLALLTGFLWRGGVAAEQLMSLLHRITYIYDQAYGWGVIAGGDGAVDYPMNILGCLVAIVVSWTVSRKRSAWLAVFMALIPLASCLVVTDTVPAEGFLFWLILGIAVLIMTNSIRRRAPEQANTLTAYVTLPLALALGLLFWLVPQEDYVNRSVEYQEVILDWARELPDRIEEMAQSDPMTPAVEQEASVNLKTLGARVEREYDVMQVFGTVDGTLYLRGQDFDFYNGFGWTATVRHSEEFSADADHLTPVGAMTIETKRVQDVLYLPYYPMEPVEMIGGRASNSQEEKRYVFTQGVLPKNWESLSFGGPDVTLTQAQAKAEERAQEAYLGLPAETLLRAEEYLGDLPSRNLSRTAMAQIIASRVRSSALYDTNTGKMPGDETDFAMWFLEESDTGYCVHFATAATVLLRAAGIPARYVSGYMAQVRAGETVTVTAKQAHAWAEYYEPVLDAWIVLEATPAALRPEGTEPGTEESAPSESLSQETGPDGTERLETTQSTEPENTPPEDDEDTDTPSSSHSVDFTWIWTLLKWLIALALPVAALIIQRQIRLRLRAKRLAEADANLLALKLWREAVLQARLLEKRPPRALEKLAQKAKYSQYTLTDDELARFDAYLEETAATLREHPWYWQLVYRYIFVIY